MTSEFHDCPKCGKPNSAYGDQFCSKCEGEYHAEQQRLADEEIAELKAAMDACTCEEGMCGHCMRNYAKMLALQGKEDQAYTILNQ
jgi:hypothetical protein